MKKIIKYILIILLVIGILAIIMRNYDKIYKMIFEGKRALEVPAEIPFGAREEILPIRAFKAKRTYFKDTLPVLGTIKGFREIDLKFEVSGILESFNFEEGEGVEEGDIIANLNQRDALLKLEYARLSLDRNEKLFEIGAIIESVVEQSRLEYESAKSEFEKTNLYAPRDGLLGRKHAEEGEYVSPNDKIGTFVDIGRVYAEFGIIEKDIPKVALNQKTEVFVDAYPGKSYKGIVDQISPLVEGRSRTQALRVRLDNLDGNLKPGMFTRGVIATYEEKNALIVPTSSVRKKEPGYIVYVVHKTGEERGPEGEELGTIEVRSIDIKYMAPDYAEISKGLKEDELVAIEVREELEDNARVEITEIQESPF